MQLNRVESYVGIMHYQIKVNIVKVYESISRNSDASEDEGNKGLRHNPIRNRAFLVLMYIKYITVLFAFSKS